MEIDQLGNPNGDVVREMVEANRRRMGLPQKTVAELKALKFSVQKVEKHGIQMAAPEGCYIHGELAALRGKEVEVRYSENDESRIWVILPDTRIVEALRHWPAPTATIQADVTTWAKAAFPKETLAGKILHLFEEIEEAFEKAESVPFPYARNPLLEEIADIGLILLNHASDFNITVPVKSLGLAYEMYRKLEICKTRIWATGADGVVRSVKTEVV